MKRWLLTPVATILLALGYYLMWGAPWHIKGPILVGILHSRTGPLAISEQSMIDSELMAISEINEAGGLLGRKVKAVITDGRSDPKVFAEQARRLIDQDKVRVIFGCWTALARRSVKAVVESSKHMLFFPSNYEGMDISSNVVCTGPIPNQQVIPAVNWCFEVLKARKFYLAGSQDIQAYSSNALIKDQLKAMGGEAVGEKYVALDGTGMPEMIAAIKGSNADVVLSTVVGDGNKSFYQQLAQAGLTPTKLPVISFTIAEDELRDLPVKEMVGDYEAWSYFQSLDSPVNREFVARFKSHTSSDRPVSDSIVASYNAVKFWAQAVEEIDNDNPPDVLKAIRRQSLEAPEGVVSVDSETLHTWRPFYVGKIRGDGQFSVVWSLEKPVRPVPFPVLRTRLEWEQFVEKLYTSWGTREFSSQVMAAPSRRAVAPPKRSSSAALTSSLSGTRGSTPYQH